MDRAMSMRKESPEVRRIRAQLAAIPARHRCSSRCRGWAVFNADTHPEIEVCDECQAGAQIAGLGELTDDDVAQLPEAERALRRAEAKLARAHAPQLVGRCARCDQPVASDEAYTWTPAKRPQHAQCPIFDPCPTCGFTLAEREDARLRAEE